MKFVKLVNQLFLTAAGLYDGVEKRNPRRIQVAGAD
jgi:hypothetical protein